MKHSIVLGIMLMITQCLSAQATADHEFNVDNAIKTEVKVLDSLRMIPQVAENPVANSFDKESDSIREYLNALINNAENNLDPSKQYSVDNAWQYKFKGTSLETELSKYTAQINKLPIGKTESEKIASSIDRRSKIKPSIQNGKEVINTFPKKTIITFYKVQYIDIVNAEISFLKDSILSKK